MNEKRRKNVMNMVECWIFIFFFMTRSVGLFYKEFIRVLFFNVRCCCLCCFFFFILMEFYFLKIFFNTILKTI
jgi:hypothetical protein